MTTIDVEDHWVERLLAGMDHEVRSAVHTIRGFAQILDMDQLTDQQAAAVGWIDSAAERLSGLVGAANEAVSVGTDTGLALGPCDPVETIWLICDQFRPHAASRGIDLDVDATGGMVIANRMALAQVLEALIDNAVRYTAEGGRISVSVRPVPNGAWQVAIQDSGPGLTNAELARAIEPFARLVPATDGGGFGLGIPVAAMRVSGMHSSLSISSDPATGTCCWFNLPGLELD